jgi:Acetoacetate decarboxylase (ADC)
MAKDLMGHQPASQGSTTLSDGSVVQMPLLTYRARTFAAFFTISAAKARALLPTDRLQPVRVSPHRALVTVQVMEYLEKTIEPYKEFVFSIPVHRSRRADIPLASVARWQRLPGDGSYITHIAVDDEQGRLIGREILGFPKFIADVEFTETPTEKIAEVSADGEAVFTLAVSRPKKPYKPQRRDFYCYSLSPVDNKLFHVPYQSEANGAMRWGSRSARLHLASHPVADELRDLDISPAPLFALDVPQYTLVSNRPDGVTDVGDWRDPRGFYRSLRTQHLAPNPTSV